MQVSCSVETFFFFFSQVALLKANDGTDDFVWSNLAQLETNSTFARLI